MWIRESASWSATGPASGKRIFTTTARTTHLETLLGFKPGQTNLIQVTVYDKDRNAYTAPELLTFVTAPLPANFPTINVLTSQPDQMEPGYMLLVIDHAYTRFNDYIAILDNSGNVVWYSPVPTSGSSIETYKLRNIVA